MQSVCYQFSRELRVAGYISWLAVALDLMLEFKEHLINNFVVYLHTYKCIQLFISCYVPTITSKHFNDALRRKACLDA